MSTSRTCSVCDRSFEPRFRYQIEEDEEGRVRCFCSQRCQQGAVLHAAPPEAACSVCGRAFRVEFAFQFAMSPQGRRHYCSEGCRSTSATASGIRAVLETPRTRRIAVFNHKGGTGKTTTAVNLAAGLAEQGKRVLLVDLDAQGNVGVSLGVRGDRTIYHVLVLGTPLEDAAVPVRANLDVVTSNETLAAAELYLGARPNRDSVLRERLLGSDAWDVVVLDCSPSLSLLNQNALVYADSVLIPVSCDYLALHGVKQVVRTLRNVHEHLRHPVRILGVLPTQHDARHRVARDVTGTLSEKFGDLCMPPIRTNIRLREAPAARQTIFEYAPDSNGAEDYRQAVRWVLEALGAGTSRRVETMDVDARSEVA